jgi:DNA-binding transcriptional LysR family regulator
MLSPCTRRGGSANAGSAWLDNDRDATAAVPDLRQLRAFVAVAEELNFTRAAERLVLGQAAVSRTIAALERELGVTLLERTSHTVRLTPAGEELLVSGREILAAADAAFARARAVGAGHAGTVRIGVSPAVGAAVRAEVGDRLTSDAAEMSIAFHEVRPRDIVALLRNRELDLVLARTVPDSPELDSAPLAPTPAMLVVPAGHRLAGRGAARLSDLDGERLLTWSPPGTPYTDLLVSRLAAAGATVKPVQSRITGGNDPPEVVAADAVAVMPAGWPVDADSVRVQLLEHIDLPLLVIWAVAAPTPFVGRLRTAMRSS